MSFGFFWTRINPSALPKQLNSCELDFYCKLPYPTPFPLEGSGLQYECAVNMEEYETVIELMKKDGHDVCKEKIEPQKIEDDPRNYHVTLRRIPGSLFGEAYALEKR